METSKFKLLALGLALQAIQVFGHGYLLQPPARGTAWRLGFNTPRDNTDNEENCGGFSNQWNVNGGKCGICGDPWNGVKENETPGKYATGTIVSTYTQGQDIDVSVRITANHKGWFEFRLCENNDIHQDKGQSCFDQHLLEFVNGGTRVDVGQGTKIFRYKLKLPPSVTCDQCILQWHYNAGNSWGTDPDGTSCVGCGPQETFRGCSDIKITASGAPTQPPADTSTAAPDTTAQDTTTNGATSDDPAPSTTPAPTQSPPSGSCRAVAPYNTGPSMDDWCNSNCAAGYCPASHCECNVQSGPPPPDATTTAETPSVACQAVAPYDTVAGMDDWCVTNCGLGNCPASHCTCP